MDEGTDIPVLVVFGPTASGKTALAGRFFSSLSPECLPDGSPNRFRGRAEIISADSMQVYRGMDIGTAKPDSSFLSALPHHLIDIRDPNEQFCAGDFVRLADIAVREIAGRGNLPVILGGTAFYVKNFLFGLPETPESDPVVRAEILSRMKVEGAARLMAELALVDPESAARIHPNDEYRIARALEVFAASGRPLSSYALKEIPRAGFSPLVVALDRPRDELNRRIDQRVLEMFDSGLEAEFRRLLAAGYRKDDPGMQAIGYREFFTTDPPGSNIPETIALIQSNSRKYAKRQETFIRSIPGVRRVGAEDYAAFSALLDGVSHSVHN
ncbi:MAG TPA: tRNA (adenosine(37)-N6)-dimethylallyltransferase MiaA [Treponemataceae bacterium]|nr:tRNA (adenosine(37)-N6)-dimethylallyltransferase MiaA [Treponemataceae bacterium]